ncbi:MAG: hypothetical protein A4E19_17050 [Nitrospira sp. SG-bin1]|nr:MAG: hypothetical protein A4E19_17050 [Nitrospira sp. SG-bin1]
MSQNLILAKQWCIAALLLAIGLSSHGCTDSASVSADVAVPLSSLTVTPGTLQPGFFANTTSYAVNAPTSAASVTVTAVPKDITTIVTINGTVTTQRSVSLGAPGSITTITIFLESQTGGETTYTVNVTRLLSSDNNLSALTVKVGTTNQTLVPDFDVDILDYTVNVDDANASSVTVSATKSDPNATIVINGQLTSSGQAIIPIGGPGAVTPVTIEVIAPNGSKKTYGITVNHLSDDNNLKDLKVEPGPLDPLFDKGTLSYTVNVATNIDNVTVTATLQNTAATMTINGQGTSSDQARDFPLGAAPSSLDINILVIAPNGSPNTYTIKVNRAAPSSNTNLSALLVTADPLNIPINHPVDLSNPQPYIVNVTTDVLIVTVTATLEDTTATMTVNGQGIISGAPSQLITLGDPGSDTPIIIEVRAQNLVDTRTYTIMVHREDPPPPPPPLP